MPAQTHLVSLDHAKDWAKRLVTFPLPIDRLARAQQAVALMLGHASWHALERFHQDARQEAPARAPSPLEAPPAPTDMLAGLTAFLNRRYPGLNAEEVEELALDVDLCKGTPECIAERTRELENEGYFSEDALGKALEELTLRVRLPPGHMMVRVRQADGGTTMMLVPSEEYETATGRVSSAPGARSRPKA